MRWTAIIAATLVAGCMGSVTPISDSDPVQLSAAQTQQIKEVVTHDFFDPSTAQFRNVRAADVTLEGGVTERRVCGEVNGKNRMGGYVGFQYFGGVIQNGQFVQKDFFGACEPF